MSLDMLAIADALADRYAPANVTAPSGYTNIRSSTARLTNNLSAFPLVEVYPPGPGESEVIYSGGERVGHHLFTVRFYLGRSSGDLPRDMAGLYAWWGVLLNQLHGAVKIGLPAVVTKAYVQDSGIGTHEYGGVEYGVVELSVMVDTSDTYTWTAA
jgi:hypothetical protein